MIKTDSEETETIKSNEPRDIHVRVKKGWKEILSVRFCRRIESAIKSPFLTKMNASNINQSAQNFFFRERISRMFRIFVFVTKDSREINDTRFLREQ